MLKLVSRRFSNYYETLGVSIDSSNLQIKTAYYKLARKYHPDLMPNKDSTKFKEINEAYATLIDPSRKENYDKEIASGNTKTSATPDDTSEYQSKYSENKGENFKMNESNYHKFWENVQKHGNKNINEERRKEYLRKHREKLDTKEGSQWHKMIWDNHRDTNFGVFLVIGTVFVIAFYYRNTFLSVIDKKVESKFQAEINKIRAEQRNAEYNEVNGIN